MKQETKQRLIYYSKIGQYFVLTLCWLMALVGVTAYSVYWLRQNANYNAEVYNKDTKLAHCEVPKKSLYYTTDIYYVYSLKERSFLGTSLYYNDNTNGYKTYFDVDFDNRPQVDTTCWANLTFDGDFYLRINGFSSTYKRLYAEFDYYVGSSDNDYFELHSLYLFENLDNSGNSHTLYSPSQYNPAVVVFKSISGITSSHFVIKQDNMGLFNYYFDLLIDNNNSTLFEFGEDYNFARLTSEVVTSERLIPPYNNQFNGDPLDEHVYYYIICDFVSNGTYYKGIFFKLIKPGLIYKDGVLNVNYYGSLSQLSVVQVCYMLNIPSGSMPSGDDIALWYGNSSNYDIVCNKHVIRYDTYEDPQGTHNVPVYDYKQYDWVNMSYSVVYFTLDCYNGSYNRVCYPRDNTMWSSSTYNKLTLYQVLNNGFSDYDYYTATYNPSMNNHLGDVFSLISSAFGGLTNLLYIQVVPGLTLGVLLLAPLIVTIIIVVLKLVKK